MRYTLFNFWHEHISNPSPWPFLHSSFSQHVYKKNLILGPMVSTCVYLGVNFAFDF